MATIPLPSAEVAAFSQAQRERLMFIDFHIYFMGELGRQHLTTRFGIAPAGATRDISLYKKLAPANLEFDTTTKLYHPSANFCPVFTHSPDHALSMLSRGSAGADRPMVSCETPQTLNYPNVEVLAAITRAVNRRKPVRVEYCSVSSGTGVREIVPFALVDTGLRWHFRGFDRRSKSFRDFVVSRVSSVDSSIDGSIADHERPEHDLQWTRVIELELIAHPSHPRPEAIALEYGFSNGPLMVKSRAATVGYLLRRWNVDCSPDHSLVGPEFALCLADSLSLYGAETAILAPGYKAPESSIKRNVE
jgi:hypothetical protein